MNWASPVHELYCTAETSRRTSHVIRVTWSEYWRKRAPSEDDARVAYPTTARGEFSTYFSGYKSGNNGSDSRDRYVHLEAATNRLRTKVCRHCSGRAFLFKRKKNIVYSLLHEQQIICMHGAIVSPRLIYRLGSRFLAQVKPKTLWTSWKFGRLNREYQTGLKDEYEAAL